RACPRLVPTNVQSDTLDALDRPDRKRIGSRWASRTSNPVSGSRQARGGFDSHALPPWASRPGSARRRTRGRGDMAKARKGQPKRGGGRPAAGAPAAASRLALTRRQRRRLVWVAGAVAGLVAVGMGGWLYARARGPIPGEFVPSLGNDHIPTAETPHVPYNSDPPTSGPHLPY